MALQTPIRASLADIDLTLFIEKLAGISGTRPLEKAAKRIIGAGWTSADLKMASAYIDAFSRGFEKRPKVFEDAASDESLALVATFDAAVMVYARALHTTAASRNGVDISKSLGEADKATHEQIIQMRGGFLAHASRLTSQFYKIRHSVIHQHLGNDEVRTRTPSEAERDFPYMAFKQLIASALALLREEQRDRNDKFFTLLNNSPPSIVEMYFNSVFDPTRLFPSAKSRRLFRSGASLRAPRFGAVSKPDIA